MITKLIFNYHTCLQRIFTSGVQIKDATVISNEGKLLERGASGKVMSMVQCFEKGYL
jgi:hypothetical protein